ncbi:MAG: magnesium/cobalt transporter CorA [Candidatus Lokiarchaeota archaeon]|nr:magnesium/cobalt transporter CorA [Candidatus Lokiarchaeota archaeon]
MNRTYSYKKKINSPPGSLVYTGTKTSKKPEITLISYSNRHYEEKKINDQSKLEEILPNIDTNKGVFWLNVDGLSEPLILEKLGTAFNLHPLTLEDILNPHPNQRPKYEVYDDGLFITVKHIDWNQEQYNLIYEQLSFVLKPGILLSFQESEENVFLPIQNRIKTAKGRIRTMDSSYLLYALLDSVVDRYFITLENIGDVIETLESNISEKNNPKIMREIHRLKSSITFMRKSTWPLRDVVNTILRSENDYIDQSIYIYFRDLSDHIHQVIDTIDNYRELLTGLMDLYLTSIGNKTNEIMKVLTIISTIFIPLTFIAGVYGMNFKFMPELNSPWGYPIVWVIMILISIGLVIYFRRKKWI